MKIIHIAPKRAVLVLGVLAASCALAACGSSSSGSSTTTASSGSATPASSTTSGFAARRAKLVACLKQHGVTLPNRPAGGAGGAAGGGFFGGGGGGGGASAGGAANPGGPNAGAAGGRGGFFRNNPKFAAAFKACGADFGFRGGGARFRLSHTAITKFVACVRQHGYNLPSPNFSGHGSVFPSNIRTNSKFEAASRACASLLRPPGAPGASGASSGTSSTPSS